MQIEEDVIGRGKIFKNFCHFLQVSLPRRGNLTSVIYLLPAFLCAHILIERETSGYEAERTQWNTGSAFRISFHLYWPIDNGFTTSQSWRVPKSWYTGEEGWGGGGGRKRLSAPFRRRSSPEFSFVCGTGFFSSAKTADLTQSPPQGFSVAVPISGDSLYYWRRFTVYRNEPVHFGLIRNEEMFWMNDNVRHVALLFVKY